MLQCCFFYFLFSCFFCNKGDFIRKRAWICTGWGTPIGNVIIQTFILKHVVLQIHTATSVFHLFCISKKKKKKKKNNINSFDDFSAAIVRICVCSKLIPSLPVLLILNVSTKVTDSFRITYIPIWLTTLYVHIL